MSCAFMSTWPRANVRLASALCAALLWFVGFQLVAQYLPVSQDVMTNLKRLALYGSLLIAVSSVAIYAGRWAFDAYVQREIQTKLAALKAVVPPWRREARLNGQVKRNALRIRPLGLATENYFQKKVWRAREGESILRPRFWTK